MKQFKRKCLVFLLTSSLIFVSCNNSVEQEEEHTTPEITFTITTPTSQFFLLYEDSLCSTKIPRSDGSIPKDNSISSGPYSYYLTSQLPAVVWGWYWDSNKDFSSFISITKDTVYLFETDSTFTTGDTLYSL